MNSPFPGMDPWLENRWGDVHSSLSLYARDELQRQLPVGLKARVEEYLSVDAETVDGQDLSRFVVPDVQIVERGPWSDEIGSASSVSVAEPLLLEDDFQSRPAKLHYIKIIEPKENSRVVTAIEFLSPTNKVNRDGRSAFRTKQFLLRQANVNLVEIDLLRVGGWVLSASFKKLPPHAVSHYTVCVRRADSSQAEIYPINLRQRLPAIRIPLRPSDADVVLDLQKLIEMSYVNGSYGDDIDYRSEPVPPLNSDDQAWADALLKSQNRR